jgi:hypothetical protein
LKQERTSSKNTYTPNYMASYTRSDFSSVPSKKKK